MCVSYEVDARDYTSHIGKRERRVKGTGGGGALTEPDLKREALHPHDLDILLFLRTSKTGHIIHSEETLSSDESGALS